MSHARRRLALAVSGEKAQHSSLLRARAVPRWLWSARAYERTLRRREASLLRRAPVVRRASCGLQRQASAACHARRVRLRSLSLGRRRSTRACCARAPCRAGCGRLVPTKGTAPARGLSPSARARGATCQLRPPTPSQRRVPRAGALRSLSLGRRRSTRACCARAPCRAGCGRLCHRKALRRREASLLRRAPWCDVPAAASNAKPAAACHARSAPALAVSGMRRSTRACCARAVPRWLWSALAIERTLRRREASLLRRAPVVRRASCSLQRQASAACHTRAARAALAVSGRRRSTRACCVRTPCRAGSLAAYPTKARCAGERPLSFGARP